MPTVAERIHKDLERDPPLYEAWRKGEGTPTLAAKYATGITPRQLLRRFHTIDRRIKRYLKLDPSKVKPSKAAEIARRAGRAFWISQGIELGPARRREK